MLLRDFERELATLVGAQDVERAKALVRDVMGKGLWVTVRSVWPDSAHAHWVTSEPKLVTSPSLVMHNAAAAFNEACMALPHFPADAWCSFMALESERGGHVRVLVSEEYGLTVDWLEPPEADAVDGCRVRTKVSLLPRLPETSRRVHFWRNRAGGDRRGRPGRLQWCYFYDHVRSKKIHGLCLANQGSHTRHRDMDIECATTIGRLFDTLPDVSDREREVAKARLTSVLGTAEQGADRAEGLDTSLFLCGFIGSLLVTITTAVNLAGYVTPSAAAAVSTAVLVLSSVGTAAMGLRERLKFRERAVVLRRTSSLLQRAAFLYLAGAGPYEHSASAGAAYRAFVRDVEAIKSSADSASLLLRSNQDDGSGGGGGGGAAAGGGAGTAGTAAAMTAGGSFIKSRGHTIDPGPTTAFPASLRFLPASGVAASASAAAAAAADAAADP